MTAPGTLTIRIDDHHLTFEVEGGTVHEVPVGPLTLTNGPLADGDPPPPASLTNALGLVHDHLDDLLIAAPSIGAVPAVIAVGPHATAMARVEIGVADVPPDYELARSAADEVFRTLAVEPVDERRHNPGLPLAHAESIIGTCCVILGIMRRFDLQAVDIASSAADTSGTGG